MSEKEDQNLGWGVGFFPKVHEQTICDTGNVFHFDCGGGYNGVYIKTHKQILLYVNHIQWFSKKYAIRFDILFFLKKFFS